MKSLAARVALLVFLVELVVLAVFGLVARSVAQRELQRSFDASLMANAEALATLTEIESDGSYEFEYAENNMPRFHREAYPELFAIMDDQGSLISKSEKLDQIPGWAVDRSQQTLNDFSQNGAAYRGVMLLARPGDVERDEDNQRHLIVFFATSRESLNAALARVTSHIALALILTGILSGLLAALIAGRGLLPLKKFARSMDTVTPANLDYEYDVDSLPAELRPSAKAFNELASRLNVAFEKERQFSACAAHELRTPVAALKVAIQAAQRSVRHEVHDTILLDDLEREATRLEELCEQLLLLTATQQEQDSELTFAEWLQTLSDSVMGLQDVAESAGSVVKFDACHINTTDFLRTSVATTRRIVTNLISNAITHSGPGVNIDVTIKEEGGTVCLCVEDDGQGVDVNDRDKIFERFFRADKSRARITGGAGLGLSLSRELARANGGDIALREKNAPGALFEWSIKKRSGTQPAPTKIISNEIADNLTAIPSDVTG